MHSATGVNASEFGVKGSKFKVAVAWNMLVEDSHSLQSDKIWRWGLTVHIAVSITLTLILIHNPNPDPNPTHRKWETADGKSRKEDSATIASDDFSRLMTNRHTNRQTNEQTGDASDVTNTHTVNQSLGIVHSVY